MIKLLSIVMVLLLLAPLSSIFAAPSEPLTPYNYEREEEANTSSIRKFYEDNKALVQGLGLMLFVLALDRLADSGDSEDTFTSPTIPTHASIDGLETMGFYVNWENNGSSSRSSLDSNYDTITSLAPFWYSIDSSGELIPRYGGHIQNIQDLCRQHDIPLLPLFNNYSSSGQYLSSAESRTATAQKILELIEEKGYDGVNMDLEMLPSWQRNNYTAFIQELSRLLRPRNYTLTLSVFPKVDVPHNLHHVYDYGALAPLVDKMVIMTYDHHWPGGPPGPIAPSPWVEANIQEALKYVPEEKLLLGVANYGYDWPAEGRAQAISARDAKALAEEMNVQIQWDQKSQSPYFHYRKDGEQHTVWFESSYSLEYKKELAERYNLAGIAIWRLGNETSRFWEVLE